MPWPISAGVFGIARTTRSLPVACAIASLRMPAITLRCRRPATNGAAARRRPRNACGLTAQTTSAASRRTRRGPRARGRRSRGPVARAAPVRFDDDDRCRAPASLGTGRRRCACAMLPPPTKAVVLMAQCTQRPCRSHHFKPLTTPATPCTSKAPAIAAPCASASRRSARCRSCTATARSAARRRAAAAMRSTSARAASTLKVRGEKHLGRYHAVMREPGKRARRSKARAPLLHAVRQRALALGSALARPGPPARLGDRHPAAQAA